MIIKTLDYLYKAASVVIIITSAIAVYWVTDTKLPFVILQTSPIPSPAKPGDEIDLQYIVALLREGCMATWVRETISTPDDRTRVYPMGETAYASLPVGGQHKMSSTKPFMVPLGAFDGDIILTSVYTIECNPYHHWRPLIYRSPPAVIHVRRESSQLP